MITRLDLIQHIYYPRISPTDGYRNLIRCLEYIFSQYRNYKNIEFFEEVALADDVADMDDFLRYLLSDDGEIDLKKINEIIGE